MANVNRVLQVEFLGERRKVVGVGIHIVAAPGLARPPMAAPVVGDGAKSVRSQKDHLVFPCVRVQRPSVTENYGLARAPVLVINACAVLGRNPGH